MALLSCFPGSHNNANGLKWLCWHLLRWRHSVTRLARAPPGNVEPGGQGRLATGLPACCLAPAASVVAVVGAAAPACTRSPRSLPSARPSDSESRTPEMLGMGDVARGSLPLPPRRGDTTRAPRGTLRWPRPRIPGDPLRLRQHPRSQGFVPVRWCCPCQATLFP